MGAARAQAFAERWVGPYERFLPGWTLRALRKGRVAGYLTGCPDTRSLLRFAGPGSEPAAAAPARLRRLVLRHYPAHLHMNVAPAFQGKGLGRRLIERYLSMLRRSGVRGVHLVCGEGPEAFYMRKGFSLLERFRSGGVRLSAMARKLKTAAAAAVLAGAASGARAEPVPGLSVGSVTIAASPIFDTSLPAESAWLFRTANALHVDTRKGVILRELLLREGDPYDPALVAESERNLRRFGFLRSVRIEASPPRDGRVDLTVRTRDAWTTEPQVNFTRSGGRNSWNTGLVERNLAGLGKGMSAFYDRGLERIHRTIGYRDPQFLGRRLDLAGGYVDEPDGRGALFSLSRPFFATITPYSVGVTESYRDTTQTLYSGGTSAGLYRTVDNAVAASYGRSLGSTPSSVRQLFIGFSRQDSRHSAVGSPTAPVPEDRTLAAVQVSASRQEVRYLKERRIQQFDRDEDYNVGPGAAAGLGLAPRWLGSSVSRLLPRFEGQIGNSFGPGHFALLRTGYSQRLSPAGRTENLLGSADLQYYNQGLPRQTFAVRAAYDHGWRPDTEGLTLGENNGLRGFSNDQFAGSRRLIFNAEDRVFFAHDVLSLVSLGGALFYDAGYAWPSGAPMSLMDLRQSVGVGLRFAFTRSTRNQPIRMDVAYALNDNSQRSRWAVSVSTGYSFGSKGNLLALGF